MNTSKKHIIIADDHGVVRYGMMLLIKDLMPWAEILQAGSFHETIEIVGKHKNIDLVILDINLLGGNNLQMIEMLNNVQDGIKILMFSAYDENMYATRYLQEGARGYLHKQTSNKEIRSAIQIVLSGGIYMSQDVKDIMVDNILNKNEDQNPAEILSKREFEVAQMLIYGHGITDISTSLNLKISTISTYKNRIFEKLNVSNLVQLIDKFRFWDVADVG